MYVDNAPGHVRAEEALGDLRVIDIRYLHPNATSEIQPVDQGIGHAFGVRWENGDIDGAKETSNVRSCAQKSESVAETKLAV